MKNLAYFFAFLVTLFVGIGQPLAVHAGRPNPPMIVGSVPVLQYQPVAGTTNVVAIPPRLHVLDERGRIIADFETIVNGDTATFEVPLKKAGTYVVWAYYPAPDQAQTRPQLAEVIRKQSTLVTLSWP